MSLKRVRCVVAAKKSIAFWPLKGTIVALPQTETAAHRIAMNETPLPPVPNAPKSSALAIWSLVLGILSLVCFYILTAIPAVICGHLALSRIKRSGGMLTGNGLAIGGLVTGYIGIALSVLVIPMLMAIAIPNFVRARDVAMRNACINNLRMIDSAKQQWALENKKEDADVPKETELNQYLRAGQFPVCPKGGTYTINPVGGKPTCSKPDHEPP